MDVIFDVSGKTLMGNDVSSSAVSQVTVFGISLDIQADPVQLETPGEPISFTVTVVNQSTSKSLTLMALTSPQLGDLTDADNPELVDTTCQTPQDLENPGSSYTCEFVAEIQASGPVEVSALAEESTGGNQDTSAQASVLIQDKPIVALYLPTVIRSFRPDEPNDTPCTSYPILPNTQHSFLPDGPIPSARACSSFGWT